MIPLRILNYNNNASLDLLVTRFVNDQLLEILTQCCDDSEYLGIIPKTCFRDKSFDPAKKIFEIRSILEDRWLRIGETELTPLNNLIIFNIAYIGYASYKDEPDLYGIKVPNDLKEHIDECKEYYSFYEVDNNPEHDTTYNFVLACITDWSDYLEFLFDDYDFTEEVINGFTNSYLLGMDMEDSQSLISLDYLFSAQEIMSDDLYYKFIKKYKKNDSIDLKNTLRPHWDKLNSFDASILVLKHFQKWVEYNRGSLVLNSADSGSAENVAQRTIYATAQMFCEEHDLDISQEEDGGRGPVDFKISKGNDKTVIEIKLSSNGQCVHGLTTQIEEYAKAENAENKILVIINIGHHSKRINDVLAKREELEITGKKPATVIVIDAKPKKSASRY